MKRSCLILLFLCASSIAGFSNAPTCIEQQFSEKNSTSETLSLSHLTLNEPMKVHPDASLPTYRITLNTVLPIKDFDGIDLVRISGDLLSVNSPVTESGASTNPTIAAEGNSSTAMVDYGVCSGNLPDQNLSHLIVIRQLFAPSAFVVRVVK